ncbi:MAG: hypothetical protein D6690_00035 [Nitrospirae bacterium]|nr:MAG: hypothetical protein D6690_00035 [Nitrospirota bacterium]
MARQVLYRLAFRHKCGFETDENHNTECSRYGRASWTIIFKNVQDHVSDMLKEIVEALLVLGEQGRKLAHSYCRIGEDCWYQNSLAGMAEEVP